MIKLLLEVFSETHSEIKEKRGRRWWDVEKNVIKGWKSKSLEELKQKEQRRFPNSGKIKSQI